MYIHEIMIVTCPAALMISSAYRQTRHILLTVANLNGMEFSENDVMWNSRLTNFQFETLPSKKCIVRNFVKYVYKITSAHVFNVIGRSNKPLL